MNSALRFLSLRSHSAGEIRIKLKRKGFSERDIDCSVDSLKESGYLDDYQFAVRYIQNKVSSRIVGERYLRRDLYRKGISNDIIESAIVEGGGKDVDFERLYEAAVKKLSTFNVKKNRELKLYNYLNNRGFDSITIKKIIEALHADGLFE
jgi:regulatory protein